MDREHFHGTPPEIYDRLAAVFGEDRGGADNATRWVEIGAGKVELIFFPERVEIGTEEES